RPPYVADSFETLFDLVAEGKVEDAHARLDASGAEPDLVALAKRCLAPRAEDRPAHGGEVAAAVAALRSRVEDRARQAGLERARALVKAAEECKRRRVQLALAASTLALLALAGLGTWWVQHQRAERQLQQERLRSGAEAALAQAQDLRRRFLWKEALAVLEQA